MSNLKSGFIISGSKLSTLLFKISLESVNSSVPKPLLTETHSSKS